MNTKITFVELVDLIAEATSTSKRMCELFLREFFNIVSQALIDGENVKIKGIGTFKVTKVKSRKNADSDQETDTRNKLTFTPDKSLAEALNQPFAQFETVFLDDAVTDNQLDEIDRLYPSYFPETGDMPTPPDYPMPPIPDADQIPALSQAKPERPAAKPTGKSVQPAIAKPVDKPVKEQPKVTVQEPEQPKKTEKAAAPATAIKKPVKPLMGIPIDGPTERKAEQPKPKPAATTKPQVEEEENDHFYRPAPRNAYSPTEEQLSRQQRSQFRNKNKRWLWIALAALLTGLCVWMLSRCGGHSESQSRQDVFAVADSDSAATAPVVTEVETDDKSKAATNAKVAAEPKVEPKAEAKTEPKVESSAETETEKESEPKAVDEPETTAKPAVVTETITPQNVLFTIAEKHYGSAWFWVYIYKENKSKISNPNNVRPGTVVVIPPAEKYGIDAKNPASVKKAQRLSWELLKGK